MFENPAFDAHERVVFAEDKESGLRAIVAVHSTRRGPAPAAAVSGITAPAPKLSPMLRACREA